MEITADIINAELDNLNLELGETLDANGLFAQGTAGNEERFTALTGMNFMSVPDYETRIQVVETTLARQSALRGTLTNVSGQTLLAGD